MKRMMFLTILYLFSASNCFSNWHAVESITDLNQNGVCFSGLNSVFIICDEGYILRSKDSGNSWQQLQLAAQHNLNSIFTLDNRIILVGQKGVIFKSTDSGEHWINISVEPYYHLNDVIFPDMAKVIAVGTKEVRIDGKTYFLATILIADDNGITWNEIELAEGELNSVACFQDGSIITVGEGGLAYKSTDYGNSWFSLFLPTNENLNSISVCPDYGAFISGNNGALFYSSDQGITWCGIYLPEYFHLKNACYRNYGDIIIAGNKLVKIDGKTFNMATILNFNTNNLHWTEEFSEQRGTYNCVSFCNPSLAIAVGDSGLIAQYDLTLETESEYSQNINFSLSQNFPNPFNPKTKIKYQLAEAGRTELTVYNLLGAEVAKLVDEVKEAGRYDVEFDGGNLASGVYFYELRSNDFVEIKKMVFLR